MVDMSKEALDALVNWLDAEATNHLAGYPADRRSVAAKLEQSHDAITALRAENEALRQQAAAAEASVVRIELELEKFAEANHRQASCIVSTGAALGPQYAATIDGLPKAARSVRERAETAEADKAAAEAILADAGVMRDAADLVSKWFCVEARHLEGHRIQALRMAIQAYDKHMQPYAGAAIALAAREAAAHREGKLEGLREAAKYLITKGAESGGTKTPRGRTAQFYAREISALADRIEKGAE